MSYYLASKLTILDFFGKTGLKEENVSFWGFIQNLKRYRFCEGFSVQELVNRIDVTVNILKMPNLGDSTKIRLETTAYSQYFTNTLW